MGAGAVPGRGVRTEPPTFTCAHPALRPACSWVHRPQTKSSEGRGHISPIRAEDLREDSVSSRGHSATQAGAPSDVDMPSWDSLRAKAESPHNTVTSLRQMSIQLPCRDPRGQTFFLSLRLGLTEGRGVCPIDPGALWGQGWIPRLRLLPPDSLGLRSAAFPSLSCSATSPFLEASCVSCWSLLWSLHSQWLGRQQIPSIFDMAGDSAPLAFLLPPPASPSHCYLRPTSLWGTLLLLFFSDVSARLPCAPG